jgi:hypothetical protein
MRQNLWLGVGAALAVAVAMGGHVAARKPVRAAPGTSARAAPGTTQRVTAWRVSDATSPEYKRWLVAAHETRWEVDAVMEALAGNLSPLQKSVILSSLLDGLAQLSSDDRRRLQERLASAALAEDLDADLSDVVGRLLRSLNTAQQQSELEGMFWELNEELKPLNKAAIVDASSNLRFVESIMNDGSQPRDVRERAVDRAGQLGAEHELRALSAPGGDATLRVTALRSLGQHAKDLDSLEATVTAAAVEPEVDEYGRDSAVAARVGASESSVSGKSLVLCVDWEQRVLLAPQQGEPELVRAMVAGKALARALLTDTDAGSAGRCIAEHLQPLAEATIRAQPVETRQVQLLAELASDLKGECAIRPEPACIDPRDRRSTYGAELAKLLLPLVATPELAHYGSTLTAR